MREVNIIGIGMTELGGEAKQLKFIQEAHVGIGETLKHVNVIESDDQCVPIFGGVR